MKTYQIGFHLSCILEYYGEREGGRGIPWIQRLELFVWKFPERTLLLVFGLEKEERESSYDHSLSHISIGSFLESPTFSYFLSFSLPLDS
jgi:hypothetical protein